ncbi:DRMBL-domain-containing protein [Lactarius hengduanensis]|nr:DRMBL-domain-containing protein [Lactarius hengduanensis]
MRSLPMEPTCLSLQQQCSSSTAPQQSKCEELADGDAFSVLVSSRKANEAWKEAETVGDRSFCPTKANGGRRKPPFYKVMQGMPAHRRQCFSVMERSLYAHSESFVDLASSFAEGTANSIIHMLSVDPKWVHPLLMDVPPNSGGITVTLIEANHWSQTVNAGDSTYKSSHVGSARIFRYLHCGDFRASRNTTLHPAVKDKRIDIIYLDTTQFNPRVSAEAKAQVISACAKLSRCLVSGQGSAEDDKGTVSKWLTLIPKLEAKGDVKLANTLILVGTYSIGKERILSRSTVEFEDLCDQRKATIIRCQSDLELHEMLTADSFSTNVHIVPLNVATSDRLKEMDLLAARRYSSTQSVGSTLARPPHREFTHADLRPARGSTPSAQLFGVSYSEHSSFFELTCFALSLGLGAHRPDGKRGERREPREDLYLDRALGGGAQEAPAWSRPPVSYRGVLVTGTVTGLSDASKRVLGACL